MESAKIDSEYIRLSINGNYHKSSSLLFCYNVTNDNEAKQNYIDSALFLDDFNAKYKYDSIQINNNDKIELKLSEKYKNVTHEVFIDSPLKIEDFSSQDANKINILNGALDFNSIKMDDQQILYTIIKGKNDYLYKKIVWIINKET